MTILISLCALWGCLSKKIVPIDYIQAEYPQIQSIPKPQKEEWLRLYFSTLTAQEKKDNWSILLEQEYASIRTEPIVAFINNQPDPISITGLLAHPDITNSQRCLIGFYAAKNKIPFSSALLPQHFNDIHDKLYCALSFAQSTSNLDPLLKVLGNAELPLEKIFYKTLVLLDLDLNILKPILEEKIRGEEDSFTYLSTFCTLFLIDPDRFEKQLVDYLLQSTEDDRLEAMEFLWGQKEALPIFQALSNSDSYSGVFAQLGVTACGGENIEFTLMYINEGATWDLRLIGLEAMGLWYAANERHKKKNRIRKELLSLIETQNDEVYLYLLRALRVSKIRESITLILEKSSTNPVVQMEQAATIRTLTAPIQ